MQARSWHTLAPEECEWQYTDDKGVRITLKKCPSHLGSWPYCLQSLSLRPPLNTSDQEPSSQPTPTSTTTSLQQVAAHNKEEFIALSNAILQSHIAEARAIRAAFAHAITEQMSAFPSGPLGQLAFVFPQQGPHCMEFLRTWIHLKAVKRLVRLAWELTGVTLIREPAQGLGQGGQPGFSSGCLQSLVACLVAGLAGVELYRAERGIEAVKSITACVGLGAGEYAAAVFSGALRFQDAMTAVVAQAAAVEEYFDESRRRDSNSRTSEVSNAIRDILQTFEINDPRVRVYSSADGSVCTTAAAVADALPFGAPIPPIEHEYKSQLRTVLAQQGVVKVTILVPEEYDETESSEDEEEEQENEEENKVPEGGSVPLKRNSSEASE